MKSSPTTGTDFDWIAPVYDALTFLIFGRKLHQAQLVHLGQIKAGAHVLIVGGGTGRLLEAVLAHNPAGSGQPPLSRILYLESSGKMLARASQRMIRKAQSGTVEFRLGDQTTLRSDERFDVIMTPYVLDLFTESTLKNSLISRLRSALKPGGCWIVTDFVRTNVWWQQALVWAMIRFFRLTANIETRRLADWQRLLAEARLKLQTRERRVAGMVTAEVWVDE
ncbi:class I SAM-dependent methyltransferase [Spirosoma taeanense]|uniref:Class I SAM-dependent methyltransferase n=1 Tax=Spirosoma taeanense TaxID=2735870 RepID=A0A6M5YAZ3_9BACT|nr:class I SAM-dependent methyltransferase [Spirosoma taeanense]QJW90401.1 class I SAM-dependent methyltransferase [Spirosoma taeanense]